MNSLLAILNSVVGPALAPRRHAAHADRNGAPQAAALRHSFEFIAANVQALALGLPSRHDIIAQAKPTNPYNTEVVPPFQI